MEKLINKIKESTNLKSIIVELRNKEKKELVFEYTKELPEYFNISQRVWHIRNTMEVQKCSCDIYLKWHKLDKGYFKTCGNSKCVKEIRSKNIENTMLEKYGVKNTMELQETKDKIKNTMLEKYGIESNLSGYMRKNNEKSMMDKHGVEHPLQKEEFKEKRRNTLKQRLGTINIFGLEKTKKTILEKYGVEHGMKSQEIIDKVVNSSKKTKQEKIINNAKNLDLTILKFEDLKVDYSCNKCNNIYNISRQSLTDHILANKNPCKKCYPKIRSQLQEDLNNSIKNLGINTSSNVRSLVKGYECDIYLKDYNLGIEFNGIYWHSEKIIEDKNYHKKKNQAFNKNNIRIIHVWEDDWNLKSDIVLSVIKNACNKSSKIFGRKCIVKEVLPKNARLFMDNNHINGFVPGTLHIGCYLDNYLVALMSIGKSRFEKEKYEILRYANLLNHTVIGGFTKILKKVKELLGNISLISYRDLSFGYNKNNVYIKNGFKLLKETVPGYSYVIDGIRYNRMNFTKKKLVKQGYDINLTESEIMSSLGSYKIYDCGNEKYEL